MMRLAFLREAGYILRWDVYEVHPDGGKSYSGELVWFAKHQQWIFQSSDGTICWKLGTNVRRAKRKVRDRYAPIDRSFAA